MIYYDHHYHYYQRKIPWAASIWSQCRTEAHLNWRHVHRHNISVPGVSSDLEVEAYHSILWPLQSLHEKACNVQQTPGDVLLGVPPQRRPLNG